MPFTAFAETSSFSTLAEPIDVELVGDQLWVMSQVTGTLQRFDTAVAVPQAVETVALGFTDGRNGNDIIPSDDALYVTQYDAKAVARVDLTSSPSTVESIPVPGRPLNGTVLDGTVWVTLQPNDASSEPMALLPIEGTTVGTPIPVPEMPYGITAIDDELWVTFDDNDRIGHIDPSAADGDFTYIDGLPEPIDLLSVDDEVWVTLRQSDKVAVIRKQDDSIRSYADAGSQPFKLLHALGSVWATNNGNGVDERGSVSRFSTVNRQPQQAVIEAGLAPIELAAGADRIFVANAGDSTVSVLTSAILVTDSGFTAGRAEPGSDRPRDEHRHRTTLPERRRRLVRDGSDRARRDQVLRGAVRAGDVRVRVPDPPGTGRRARRGVTNRPIRPVVTDDADQGAGHASWGGEGSAERQSEAEREERPVASGAVASRRRGEAERSIGATCTGAVP